MSRSKGVLLSFTVMMLLASSFVHAMPAGSRIMLPTGKNIFISGMNLAWKNYAGDVGDAVLDTAYYNKAMKDLADSGANCIRVWLSTDGTNDPKYGTDGLVTGPGSQTVVNIQKMLNIARKNKLLLMPVLLTHNWVNKSINATILENNKKMLKTEAGLQAYIDNYVTPVVTAIGNDPSLICWEVYNEPEGMVQGWSSPANTITQAEVQRSVNWIAAAIRAAVPEVLVSNGAATIGTLSWYRDDALKTVGGKDNGHLDFYMAHYYGWNGTSNSPFTKNYAAWNLDKPLVIGEYASTSWSQSTSSSNPMQDAAKVDTLLVYLDKAGYAGGLGWQYQRDAGDPWMLGFASFGHSIAEAYRADSNSIKLDGIADNTFLVVASAGSGGTVTASTNGRIESGKSDTLTATPFTGYTFTGWSGDTTATSPVLVIPSVTKDWVLQANFTPDAGTNLIRSGDFTDQTMWALWADAENGNEAVVAFTDQQAKVTITASDSFNYHIQLTQGNLELDSGVTYVLNFDGWSSGDRTLFVGLSTVGTWHFQGGGEVNLTATRKNLSIEITPDSSTVAGILQFNLGGGSLLPVSIANVQMVRKPGTDNVVTHAMAANPSVSFTRTANAINWSARSQRATASLIDLQGRVIESGITRRIVSIAGTPNGVYLFRVKDGISSHTFKFIICSATNYAQFR